MPSDSKAQHPPSEQEHLPCPRCDSTNTKFCYYNNYNFSQPRHFCKSCRRYWTHGGTLRDIPVGGGTRKNAKRSRTAIASATSSSSAATPMMTTLPAISTPLLLPLSTNQEASTMHFEGSFSSLFGNNTGEPSGFLTLGEGFGLGLGPGFEDLYGLGRGGWVDGSGSNIIGDGAPVVASSWHHLEGGEGGGFVNGERFSWPGLAISTHGNCLR